MPCSKVRMNVCPPHLKSCNHLELFSQSFGSRGETWREQRLLGEVEGSAHVAPTVVLQPFAVQAFSKPLSAALSIFHLCILPKEAGLFIFPNSDYLSGHWQSSWSVLELSPDHCRMSSCRGPRTWSRAEMLFFMLHVWVSEAQSLMSP